MHKANTSKRSPLKSQPLRLPGQSVQDEIDRLLDDGLVSYIFYAASFVLVAAMEWLDELADAPPQPLLATLVAVVICAFCAFKVSRTLKKVRRLKLGRDGERIVAEQLDQLKRDGDVIFHDVVGDGFNLDHVILSKQGIFVAETKTLSKPSNGSPVVKFDGKDVLVDGQIPDRDPIAQVRMNATWLQKTLQESTGKRFPVKGAVLFPGWWVEPTPKDCPVWLLEPKALPAWVRHEPVRITDSDLHLVAFHLTRMLRSERA